ncbi:hypothetical protein CAL29_04725 [Bordetella genomosp. 10]|uniref:Uncharacterized protein n=1 Tax=Bordetella genomosp. 10 TaxID=1416804 RepID=A0A261SL12_9BORD|nr:hypothetical protein [Bordetella genomosp. 10]OZI37697.1 hypothetical protein CAL29_04725 [Bordetella genomosp. 10]
MKILTKETQQSRATLWLEPVTQGGFRWEVEVVDTGKTTVPHVIQSEHVFRTPTDAALDGIRALESLAVPQ